jgi:predicted permease
MWTISLKICSIFFMLGMGILARRRRIVNAETTLQLSNLCIRLVYPALIYASIVSNFTISKLWEHRLLPTGAFLIMALGFILGQICLAPFNFSSDRRKNAVLFQCTMNNYSFLPMPLALLFWGEQGLALLIFSTIGSEIAVWTLGIYSLKGGKFDFKELRHLLSMPMLAIMAALLTLLLQVPANAWGINPFRLWSPVHEFGQTILSSLNLFGKATIPIAMVVAGSRTAGLNPRHMLSRDSLLVALMRLVIVPGAVATLLFWLPMSRLSRDLLLLIAVMPSAVAGVMLSDLYDSDSDFAASSVLITHLLCLITIPVWLILHHIG